MVDSVGIQPVPHPGEPDMSMYQLELWKDRIVSRTVSAGVPTPPQVPAILHNCHNWCGSPFSGPTLITVACNSSDPHQLWELVNNNTGPPGPGLNSLLRTGFFRDEGSGLCVGCTDGPMTGCGNDAMSNATGLGHGMRTCQFDFNGGNPNQRFNLTKSTGMILRGDGMCIEVARAGQGPQVVLQQKQSCNGSAHQRWSRGAPIVGVGGLSRTQLHPDSAPSMCLASGPVVTMPQDPWCAENNNMWRSNTDSIQQWGRLTTQIASFVGQGTVSKPGAWAFGDCLEVGVPGIAALTWQETMSHIAIWSVCSQPLFLGNDVREGYIQPRLLELMLNPDMLRVNQVYAGNAGDRLWTGPMGQEVWGKPLPNRTAAIVVLNQYGLPLVTEPGTCTGQWAGWCGACNTFKPIDTPCDDNATVSIGAQTIKLDFSVIPSKWLAPAADGAVSECEVFDIFASPQRGKSLGRMHEFVAQDLPPHGSRFLLVRNCGTVAGVI